MVKTRNETVNGMTHPSMHETRRAFMVIGIICNNGRTHWVGNPAAAAHIARHFSARTSTPWSVTDINISSDSTEIIVEFLDKYFQEDAIENKQTEKQTFTAQEWARAMQQDLVLNPVLAFQLLQDSEHFHLPPMQMFFAMCCNCVSMLSPKIYTE
jgi:hypothetical protein